MRLNELLLSRSSTISYYLVKCSLGIIIINVVFVLEVLENHLYLVGFPCLICLQDMTRYDLYLKKGVVPFVVLVLVSNTRVFHLKKRKKVITLYSHPPIAITPSSHFFHLFLIFHKTYIYRENK